MEVDLVPVDQPQSLPGRNGSSETQASASTPFDLVGGSFSVIESDPGWSFLCYIILSITWISFQKVFSLH